MIVKTSEEITYRIITEFSKTLEMFGLTPVEARLFACLYLVNEPMTLDEMSDAIGKSKTSMSTSIRTLADMNLVTRVWKKGIRKDLYQANSQLFKSFMNSYLNKWLVATTHQKDALAAIEGDIQEIEGNTSKEMEKLNDYLDNIIQFHEQVEELFREMKQE
ncbi:GbsR/MarR family transcriptional regulator [Virgibacillus xinjiangensis]|uniref:HTH-type transcriptional regulator n=1 Tax=Virgibacillus xinjiangensis TaxID=393090 RepID=A0ABV7CWE9_9BACI